MINTIKRFLGIHIHEWTRWDVVDAGNVTTESNVTVYVSLIQQRHCTKCGYVQLKRTEH